MLKPKNTYKSCFYGKLADKLSRHRITVISEQQNVLKGSTFSFGYFLYGISFCCEMGQAQTKNKKGLHKFESKEEYFIKNGGMLLEKQRALCQGKDIVGEMKVISQNDIKKATNNYDPNLVFGRNNGANASKGTLDDRLVFIKTPQWHSQNPELLNLFLNEASILMVIHHDNMSKIYGCCLETYIPMIVYYYTPSTTLHRYLHGDMALQKRMKWRDFLKVVTDVAHALSYMHNALSKPLVHRDVKSLHVLVDSSFHATLANVGHSVSITPGKKHQRWPVHGPPGYIDPEYIETQEVTDKCDVYSFGVLMVELLTAREPDEMARCGKDLVTEFVSGVGRKGIMGMINNSVLADGNTDEIQSFAWLAMKCVSKKGECWVKDASNCMF